MNTNKSTTGIDPRIKLSLLWVFVVLSMAYADILSLMDPTSAIREVIGGSSIAFRRFGAWRNCNGNLNCYGCLFLGIELQGKSMGDQHHRPIHDLANRCRRTWFVLSVFYGNRSSEYIVDHLVFMEVETSS